MLYITNKICDDNFIDEVDIYFNYYALKYIEHSDLVKRIINDIDGAKWLGGDIIETRHGKTIIQNISSGCKALIIAVLNPNLTVSFIEAGNNVFELALELSKSMEIHIYTQNRVVIKHNHSCNVNFNGKIMTAKEWMDISLGGYNERV